MIFESIFQVGGSQAASMIQLWCLSRQWPEPTPIPYIPAPTRALCLLARPILAITQTDTARKQQYRTRDCLASSSQVSALRQFVASCVSARSRGGTGAAECRLHNRRNHAIPSRAKERWRLGGETSLWPHSVVTRNDNHFLK